MGGPPFLIRPGRPRPPNEFPQLRFGPPEAPDQGFK